MKTHTKNKIVFRIVVILAYIALFGGWLSLLQWRSNFSFVLAGVYAVSQILTVYFVMIGADRAAHRYSTP